MVVDCAAKPWLQEPVLLAAGPAAGVYATHPARFPDSKFPLVIKLTVPALLAATAVAKSKTDRKVGITLQSATAPLIGTSYFRSSSSTSNEYGENTACLTLGYFTTAET